VLITVQFPIADVRCFVSTPTLRLPVPDWPAPTTASDPQFVHHFGKATERRREPDAAWPDELQYVIAKRGLRFDRLETRHAGLPKRRFHPCCAFCRLFCDGEAVVRMEIGIGQQYAKHPLNNLATEEILAIVRQLAEIPTEVPNSTGKLRPIVAQGKELARLYALASMQSHLPPEHHALGLQLVEAGAPIIIAELKPNEADLDHLQSLGNSLIVQEKSSVHGANAIFCHLKTQAGIVSIWILQKGNASDEQLRSLRICLSRLHTEREVLDLTIKQIQRRRLLPLLTEEDANMLDRFFNKKINITNRSTWGGIKQSEIVAACDAAKAVIRPASKAQLLSRYEGCRRQIWEKINIYQEQRRAVRMTSVVTILQEGAIMAEKMVIVTGSGNIVNVAEYMSNVTNTVNNNLAQSNADESVNDLIKQLNEHLERIAPEIEPSQLRKMGKNLTALSKEVSSDEPERR